MTASFSQKRSRLLDIANVVERIRRETPAGIGSGKGHGPLADAAVDGKIVAKGAGVFVMAHVRHLRREIAPDLAAAFADPAIAEGEIFADEQFCLIDARGERSRSWMTVSIIARVVSV